MKKLLGALTNEIQLFGTTINVGDDMQGDIESLIARKVSKYSDLDTIVSESVPFCMFHPNRRPKIIWNIILIFLLVYTATVMPYRIAFIENKIFDAWFYVDLLIDILFLIDVIVN